MDTPQIPRARAVEDRSRKVLSRPLLIVEPRVRPSGLAIVFHGAGDNACGWRGIAEKWGDALPHVKFVIPTAPLRGKMTAWFGRNKSTGMLQNYEAVWKEAVSFIDGERAKHGVPLHRVVLIGLSAGALMAAWVALNLPGRCGGLVLLSGGVPSPERLPDPALMPGVDQTPVLYCNGSADVQITAPYVLQCVDRLRGWGLDVEHQIYPDMGHELRDDELDEVLAFLLCNLPIARAQRPRTRTGLATRSAA